MSREQDINDLYFDLMEDSYLTRIISKPTVVEYKVNDNLGSGMLNRVILNKGLQFCISKDNTVKREIFNLDIYNKRFIEINYCKGGKAKINLGMDEESVELEKGDLMFYRNHSLQPSGCFCVNMKNYTGLNITLDINELRKFFFPGYEEVMLQEWDRTIEALFKGNAYFKIKAPPSIECDIKNLLNYDYNFECVTSLLLCQSKLMEIILKSVKYGISKRKEINLTKADKVEIYKAKDILTKDIQYPPSIEELSDMCNTNSYKLKKGFKKLFNNTPYGYLREIRMYEGKNLLENTDMNISEIANIVGYSNPSKFSESFKIKFNITPSEYRKVNKGT